MSRKDRDKLLIIGVFLGIILMVVVFYFGSKVIPWYLIIVTALAAEFVYFAPRLCSDYYQLNTVKIGNSKWIPLYNELCLMNSSWVKATLVTLCITGVIFVLRFVPNSVIGKFFGLRAGMFWGYNIMPVLILAIVALNIVFGLGLCAVFRSINAMIMEYTHASLSKLEGVYYLLLVLPLVRICAIATMYSKTQMLIKTGYGYQDNQTFTEQAEGE